SRPYGLWNIQGRQAFSRGLLRSLSARASPRRPPRLSPLLLLLRGEGGGRRWPRSAGGPPRVRALAGTTPCPHFPPAAARAIFAMLLMSCPPVRGTPTCGARACCVAFDAERVERALDVAEDEIVRVAISAPNPPLLLVSTPHKPGSCS